MDGLAWNGMLSGTMDFDLEDIIEYLRKSGAKPSETEARNIFRNHSEYLAKYLKSMPEGEGAGQADSLVGSDREEPPSKRARSENIDGDTGQDSLGQKE